MVTPDDIDEVRQLFSRRGMQYEVMIPDVQKLIDGQWARDEVKALSVDPEDDFYTVYHRYAELDQWVKNMAARYPTLAEEFIMGRSYEKRVMRGLKVGNQTMKGKPAMWIHSGIHAREWITPATNIWMTNKMLSTYGKDDRVTQLLDMFDLYILPSLNPDGYEYTWDVYRLWRKTRSVNVGVGPDCYGVDANRNWGHEFGGGGTSGDPCSYVYRGEYPHSEIEVLNVINFIEEKSNEQSFKFFMDIHSYSQMWLNPWGYTYQHPKDYDDHMAIGKAFRDALYPLYNTTYTYGALPDELYIAAGVSIDWAYAVAGIKYSHTTELRDTGKYAFILPPEQILPTAKETYEGMMAAYEFIMTATLNGEILEKGFVMATLIPSCFTLVCCLLFLMSDQVKGEQQRFDSYQVIRAKVQTESDAAVMREIQESGKYDFWDYPNDIMAGPKEVGELRQLLKDNGIVHDVWIKNVQALIDRQYVKEDAKPEQDRERRSTGAPVYEFDYSVYHRWSELDQWLLDTRARYPNLTEIFTIGRSYEKRVMRGIKIGKPADETKEAMWIHSGIHAREWISPATNIWMTYKMLEDYGTDPDVTTLMNRYDFYVLLSLNPDGYEYTWTDNRLWRKTRSPNLNSDCIGTDPNRNWADGFGGPGSSGNPCSITYRGPFIHSEVEVRNAVDYIKQKSKSQKFVYFQDIHSYSQLYLVPWGYKYEHPKDYDANMAMGKAFADALRAVHGTNYTVGTPPDVLYRASGIAVDWGYGGGGIKYSGSLELRDQGQYGFLLPPEQILPTAEETYAGMIAGYMYLMNNP
ncbi:carboxypeptidase A1-like [Ptychodera flava]|uniref:carboxypeptidase A1-like n=1 Tax=Ptychodera flava TaxID=63121 RepID=UPI003969E5C8